MVNAPKPVDGVSPDLSFDDLSSPEPVQAAPTSSPTPAPEPEAIQTKAPATVVEMKPEASATPDAPAAPQAATSETSIDDLIGDVDVFLSTPAPEAQEYKASPQADFRFREVLSEANGDPKRAALILADRFEAATRELEEAKGVAIGASEALEQVFPAEVSREDVEDNIRYDLQQDAWRRFGQDIESRVQAHITNPKSKLYGHDPEDVREALRYDFEMGLPAYIERVLPVAFSNHVARHKEAREARLKQFSDSKQNYLTKFREEQSNAARALDKRVSALAPVIGDNQLLKHLAYMELAKQDGPSDDRERFAAAEQRYYQEMAASFNPETYAKNEMLRESARRAVVNDPQVKAGISRAIAKGIAAELARRGITDTPEGVAPVKVVSTDTSITRGSGWGRRPEQGGISEYTFDDVIAGR